MVMMIQTLFFRNAKNELIEAVEVRTADNTI
jgi:hypothetical protein